MITRKLVALLLIFCPLLAGAVPVSAGQAETGDYTKMLALSADGSELELPLKHTKVEAELSGYVSQVEVEQEYENNLDEAIEAVYMFPLPENAAVNSMEMQIGQRIIKAEMKEKEKAREIYEEAKKEGKRASLLDQERPNVFVQSVANIMPGDKIIIRLTYIETLTYDDGRYSFRFPMVVGHRYNPTDPQGRNLNPTVLPSGMRSGHDISLKLELDTKNIPVSDIKSESHEVIINSASTFGATVELSPADSIPNRDFVLSYRTTNEKADSALLYTKNEGEDGYFTLMVQPPAAVRTEEILPKEIIFIVDVSGSMKGRPIEIVRQAMEYSLSQLRPNDSFNLFLFSSNLKKYSPKSLIASPENVSKAIAYVKNIQSDGGTEMMPAIREALKGDLPLGQIRVISIMTDGGISNDDEVISEIQKAKNQQVRWFPFSVGSAGNHYLIEQMADAGRGKAFFVAEEDKGSEVVSDFYESIASPLFVNLQIDWGGLETYDVFPQKLPDLFAGEPLYVHGRYRKAGDFQIKLSGQMASVGNATEALKVVDQELLRKIYFPDYGPGDSGIDIIWARSKIKDLMNQERLGLEPAAIKQEIIATAIKYKLMSNYTSFVAVEELIANKNGETRTVIQPVETPLGVEMSNPAGGTLWQAQGGANWEAAVAYNSLGLATDGPLDISAQIINLILVSIALIASLILLFSSFSFLRTRLRLRRLAPELGEGDEGFEFDDPDQGLREELKRKKRNAKIWMLVALILLFLVFASFALFSFILDALYH
jgi:Ca-activated chloride channel family protein